MIALAKLVINPTSASKKEIPISSRVISIGRDPSNDLVLSDSMVSRRHAILEQREDIYVLRDNNSSNGTMVNGDKVEAEKTLRDGDLLAIGSSRLLFQLEEGVASGSHPAVGPVSASPVLDNIGDLSSDGDPLGDSTTRPDGPHNVPCPSCGRRALGADRFCRSCGSELHEKKDITCTACGNVMPLPAEFCSHCGHELPVKPRESPPTRHLNRADLLADAPLADEHVADEPVAEAPPPQTPTPPPAPIDARPRVAPHRRARREEEEAGFGIRAIAALIDGMIVGIPYLALTLLLSMFIIGDGGSGAAGGWMLASALFPLWSFAYYVLFWGLQGATPGKSLLGLSVQTDSGDSPVGIGVAALRALGYVVSSLPFGLGFIMIAFSEDKRGLHDRIASTRVMRTL